MKFLIVTIKTILIKVFIVFKKFLQNSDIKYMQLFFDYMNKRAADIGMSNSLFVDSSGWSENNKCTANDIAKLSIDAFGYTEIKNIWGTKNKEIFISGKNPRSVVLVSTVQGKEFEEYYVCEGGKTGTVNGVYNLLIITKTHYGDYLSVVILKSNTDRDRFVAAKQAVDIALKKRDKSNYDEDEVNAKIATVSIIPSKNHEKNIAFLYEKNKDALCIPASITKVLTCICLLDLVRDLEEKFVVKKIDIIKKEDNFSAGDEVSYRDALYAMLLASDNNAANAIARVLGKKLKKNKFKI